MKVRTTIQLLGLICAAQLTGCGAPPAGSDPQAAEGGEAYGRAAYSSDGYSLDAKANPRVSRDDIIGFAKTAVGSPYVWGGTQWDPSRRGWKGPDCSGFVGKAWMVPSKVRAQDQPSERWTTYEFRYDRDRWSETAKTSLKAGDAMVERRSNGTGHIILFTAYDDNGAYRDIEARGKAYGVVRHVRSRASTANYIGIRRKNLAD